MGGRSDGGLGWLYVPNHITTPSSFSCFETAVPDRRTFNFELSSPVAYHTWGMMSAGLFYDCARERMTTEQMIIDAILVFAWIGTMYVAHA